MTDNKKPILVLDFDGVIHSYSSGWKGADVIPDPPVPGAMAFLFAATEHFRIAIFSSRSNQLGGLKAMINYVARNFREQFPGPADRAEVERRLHDIEWPLEKPPAFLTIDDRALCFTGNFADFDPVTLLTFQPWNKRAFAPKPALPACTCRNSVFAMDIDRCPVHGVSQ